MLSKTLIKSFVEQGRMYEEWQIGKAKVVIDVTPKVGDTPETQLDRIEKILEKAPWNS